MAEIVEIVERGECAVLVEPDIIENERQVLIDIRRIGFVDDQGAVQSALDLLHALGVAVIPIGARIGQGEIIGEHLAGPDGRLRQARHTIHRVVQA